ncbi:MAG: hypothetical protein GOVbin1678_37 [Prokaryotic dsDNA virus sp.]|nr:MAG: hypothetical protein GOVbin1678_37 [Prokaryotic dsDNA virus sp.]
MPLSLWRVQLKQNEKVNIDITLSGVKFSTVRGYGKRLIFRKRLYSNGNQ